MVFLEALKGAQVTTKVLDRDVVERLLISF